MAKKRTKTIIGWREWVTINGDTPLYIKAKIDTGAQTSSIHATWVTETEVDGIPHVSFWINPGKGRSDEKQKFCLPLRDKRWIRNSFGKAEIRYVVKIPVKIGRRIIKTEFTLSKRWKMAYPILIGRKTLKGKFFIDAQRSYMTGKPQEMSTS